MLIAAIPTTYRGVRFRSRLEARWASLFDRLGWQWDYEPLDLAFYIPDFVLAFEAGRIAVEVKPETDCKELSGYVPRVVRAGWNAEILILGASLLGESSFGVLAERHGTEALSERASAFDCISCGAVSLLAEGGSWRCRRCGADDGNAHVGWLDDGVLRAHWAEAGNRVQWRGA